jgi:hypothetical protein
MFFEAILFPVQDIPLNAANETYFILICLQLLLLLPDLGKLVDDDGSDDLVHDDLDDEEIAEVDEHVPEGNGVVIAGEVVSVVEADEALIGFEADAEGEDKAVVESAAVGDVVCP